MQIWFGDKSYSSDQLLKSAFLPFKFSKNQRKVINFVKKWQSGEDLFEFETSGTTGERKKVAFDRERIKASINATARTFFLNAGQCVFLCLSPDYIAGKMMIARAVELDLDLIVVDPSTDPLSEVIVDKEIHFAAFVPYQVKTMMEKGLKARLEMIHKIIIGGAPLPTDLVPKLKLFNNSIFETYGMTETLTHIAVRRLSGNPEEYFHILEGVTIRKDERGCLVIKAPATNDNEVITNDLVDIIDDHRFRVKGRIDNVINSGGIKLQPEMLEDQISPVLHSLNINNPFFVGALPDPELGQKAVLVIESENIFPDKIILWQLKDRMDKHMAPREIHCLPSFQWTENGKILRDKTLNELIKND